jgi:hypothetical protein
MWTSGIFRWLTRHEKARRVCCRVLRPGCRAVDGSLVPVGCGCRVRHGVRLGLNSPDTLPRVAVQGHRVFHDSSYSMENRDTARSHSQLSSWLECGKRFELEKVLKVPRLPGIWFPAGTACHATVEWWLRDRLARGLR